MSCLVKLLTPPKFDQSGSHTFPHGTFQISWKWKQGNRIGTSRAAADRKVKM